ncbi:MAG: hypothetical protein AAFP89_25470 [Bacteroidota bacterium]
MTGLLALLVGGTMALASPPDSTKKKLNIRKLISLSGQLYAGGILQNTRYQEEPNLNLIGSGQLNIMILDKVNVPLSFTYRDGQSGLSIPISQLGINPGYKSWRFYLGQNNIDLTPGTFTLRHRNIHGAGLTVNRNKIGVSIFRGRLTAPKLLQDTFSVRNYLNPQVGARFMATRLRLGKEQGTHLYAHLFLAKDDTLSTGLVNPKQGTGSANFIPELGLRVRLRKFSFQGQVTPSIYTRNIGLTGLPLDSIPVLNRVGDHFPVNISTRLNIAAKSRMDLNLGKFRLQVRSDWVDPFFQSMGLFYVQDDRFTYTIRGSYATGNYQKAQKKDKKPRHLWILSASLERGFQTNNIKNTRAFTTRRDVYAGNISFNIKGSSEKSSSLAAQARHQNFIIDLNPGLTLLADSLKLTQLTSGGNASLNWTGDVGNSSHSLSLQFIDQQLKDLSKANDLFGLKGISLNYRPSMKRWSPELGIDVNRESRAGETRDRLGISLNNNLDLVRDRLSIQTSAQYVQYRNEANVGDGSLILRGSLILKIAKKQSLSLSHQSHLLKRTGEKTHESRTQVFYRIHF